GGVPAGEAAPYRTAILGPGFDPISFAPGRALRAPGPGAARRRPPPRAPRASRRRRERNARAPRMEMRHRGPALAAPRPPLRRFDPAPATPGHGKNDRPQNPDRPQRSARTPLPPPARRPAARA